MVLPINKNKMDSITNQNQTLSSKHNTFSAEHIIWLNRFSLFIVFFWFGFLKLIGISPAESLVSHLHVATIANYISIDKFLYLLGFMECLIGLLWLMPKLTKLAFGVFLIQMSTTFLPLIYLPKDTWQNTLVLTLTGQYIIKNIVLIASAFSIYHHFQEKRK